MGTLLSKVVDKNLIHFSRVKSIKGFILKKEKKLKRYGKDIDYILFKISDWYKRREYFALTKIENLQTIIEEKSEIIEIHRLPKISELFNGIKKTRPVKEYSIFLRSFNDKDFRYRVKDAPCLEFWYYPHAGLYNPGFGQQKLKMFCSLDYLQEILNKKWFEITDIHKGET